MAKLLNRVARVTIKSTTTPLFDEQYAPTDERTVGIVIENLRIQFEIEHNLTKHPNQCLITIYNLAERTRAALKKRPLSIVLEAGYDGDVPVIFMGDITYALSSQDGPNWVTKIQCGDGDRVSTHARVSKSYRSGTTLRDVVTDIFRSSGQQVPDIVKNGEAFNKTFKSGFTAFGKHKKVITDLLSAEGYSWSIQDGQPVILREDDATGETYIIDERHGMIGSPEFGHPDRRGRSPDVTIKSLLHPRIRPGHPISVKSRDMHGLFKVKKVKHSGDNLEGDWETEITISSVAISPASGAGLSKQGRSSKSGGAGSSF